MIGTAITDTGLTTTTIVATTTSASESESELLRRRLSMIIGRLSGGIFARLPSCPVRRLGCLSYRLVDYGAGGEQAR